MPDINDLDRDLAAAQQALAAAERARAAASVDFNDELDALVFAVGDWAQAHGIDWTTAPRRKNVTTYTYDGRVTMQLAYEEEPWGGSIVLIANGMEFSATPGSVPVAAVVGFIAGALGFGPAGAQPTEKGRD